MLLKIRTVTRQCVTEEESDQVQARYGNLTIQSKSRLTQIVDTSMKIIMTEVQNPFQTTEEQSVLKS